MIPQKNVTFIIIDLINNANSHSSDKIGNLLLQNGRLWISTLAAIRKNLNSTNDWNIKHPTKCHNQ